MHKEEKVTLREVEEKDCKLLWMWRNEKSVRDAALHTAPIKFQEHENWFNKKISSPKTKMFIIMNEQGKPVGQVRFEIRDKNAEVSISIDKTQRKKGYAVRGLLLACKKMFAEHNVRKIIGYIKIENEASLMLFKKAGFSEGPVMEIINVEVRKVSLSK